MTVSEINPFIRFSGEVLLTETGYSTLSYDHRLFYITDGSCSIDIEGTEHILQNGSVVLIQSGTRYKFSINEKIKIIVLNFDYSQKFSNIKNSISPVKANLFNKNKILEQVHFFDAKILNMPIVISDIYEINQFLHMIIEENQKGFLYSNEFSSALLKEIILKILRFSVFSSSGAYNRISLVIRYIEENYSKNISNDELAKISGYHPYHLNRLMNKYVKTTIHKYLTNYRIKKSQEYLTDTDFSISEISDLCGFKTPYYFSNSFKGKFNISPLQYRKKYKRKIY